MAQKEPDSHASRGTLVPRRRRAVVVPGERRPALPAPTLKQAGQAAAVSLATLAVRAGAAWVKKQLAQRRTATAVAAKPTRAIVPADAPAESSPKIRIERRRVVRIWRQGEVAEQWIDGESWTLQQDP